MIGYRSALAALLALGATYYPPALAPVKEEAEGTHAQTIRF